MLGLEITSVSYIHILVFFLYLYMLILPRITLNNITNNNNHFQLSSRYFLSLVFFVYCRHFATYTKYYYKKSRSDNNIN